MLATSVCLVCGQPFSIFFQNVTLFGHDLGGPTGMSVVRREPQRFSKLVLLNTWLPQGDIFSSLDSTARHIPYLAFRKSVALMNRLQPVGLVVSAVSTVRNPELQGYRAPYPTLTHKAGPAKWPLLIPLNAQDPMAVEMRLARDFVRDEWSGPVLFGYSDGELFTTATAGFMRDLFSQVGCETLIENAGHFLMEDQPDAIAEEVVTFISKGCPLPIIPL